MSLLSILETLLIGPLKLAFEFIFEYANRFTGHPGLSIVCLSLVMNVLVLPLYRRADAMQEQARDTEAKLKDGVAHIKKTFSGDERMMMLQTYYRQNHYKPTDALNGSVSLLLEIPFFIAAYQFLSHLGILEGVSLGPIRDLSQPDGLLALGGLTVNILPLLMTGINLLSGAVYLRGFPVKAKVQLYTMAGLFLVLLYRSTSGLVFYWTLNNLFSLGKNICYRLKDPRKVLRWLCAGAGLALAVFGLFFYETESEHRKILLALLGLALCLPLAIAPFRGKLRLPVKAAAPEGESRRLFLAASLFMTVLVGLLIPSEYIAASPQEYVAVSHFYHPLWHVVRSVCMAAGTFLIWMRVFYWLASPGGKRLLSGITGILCVLMLTDYMFFGTDLGVISSALIYEKMISFTLQEQMLNLLVLAVLAGAAAFCISRMPGGFRFALTVCAAAMVFMSLKDAVTIKTSIDQITLPDETESGIPSFQFSKTGKNVVVLVLDRAMGEYIPYIFQEKPELKEQFSGFTYYENTISFGGYTRFGMPPLLGGYEYTPVEMNRRDEEALVSKNNEALKVMPAVFGQNGFAVTVCNPPYANFQWISDLSVFDDFPEIRKYSTAELFLDKTGYKARIERTGRNFFCFSLMKTLPLFIQPSLYDYGNYHRTSTYPGLNLYSGQVEEDTNLSVATGTDAAFLNEYLVLDKMPEMTDVTEEEKNSFMFLYNCVTHEPQLLQEPDYVPSQAVDNTEYDLENAGRFTIGGRTLLMNEAWQMRHYHVNMAALLRLGTWFDHLRENGVYDNTRIILVADHGRDLEHFTELFFDDGTGQAVDVESYFPLLMVKDFDSQGFTVSDEFMTNADVPALATKDLIPGPVNPFTGKPLTSGEKFAHDQFIILSEVMQANAGDGNTFQPSKWASVKNNIWDRDNWTFYNRETVLKEHAMP